jgi:short-subunit dehydrogenase
MKLKEKVIVITGAGSGIGRALSLEVLAWGGYVAGIDINPDSLSKTRELAGKNQEKFRSFTLDITDKEKTTALPLAVQEHFGKLDGLINNAGIIQRFVKVQELTEAEIHRVFDINFFSTLHLIRVFLPHLLERPESLIANVSSMGGFLPVPGQTIYGASKAAVKLLTEGLYAELKDTPVQVASILPGAIDTNITENSGLERPKNADAYRFKALDASKAAEIIVRGIEQNQLKILVGSDASMMDKLYRLAPKYAVDLIAKKMKSLLR